MNEHHTETDILRLTASFAVVLLHVSARRLSGADWELLPCAVNGATRFAVPLFVMISGRYMLSAPCPIRRGLSKAGRTVGVMLLWSTLYLLYALYQGWRPAGAGAVVLRLTTEPIHLWYFWAIAALYLFTPVLSAFAANANRRLLLYAVVLTGIFGSPVTLLLRAGLCPLLSRIMEQSKLPYAMGFLHCYLLGRYLSLSTHTHTFAGGGQSVSPRRRFYAGAAHCGCPNSRVIGAGLC